MVLFINNENEHNIFTILSKECKNIVVINLYRYAVRK